jgi:hypothetical protein
VFHFLLLKKTQKMWKKATHNTMKQAHAFLDLDAHSFRFAAQGFVLDVGCVVCVPPAA